MFVPSAIFLQKASKLSLIVLSGLLAYQFALLTWSLSPVKRSNYQWVAPKTTTATSNSIISTQKLQQQHLFGNSLSKKIAVKRQDTASTAPKTKLNVVLVGVVAASEPRFSSAIISSKNKQNSYFIDSEIEGTQATVSEIYEDRVILNVRGALQTLMLDGSDDQVKSSNKRKTSVTKQRSKSVSIPLDRKALLKNPSKLTDYIRISPYRKDGQVMGYRLKPGKDRSLFESAGFQRNDLAIELNGVDLTDTKQAFSLMKEFSTMTEISLTVERNGQRHELSLNIP